MLWIIEASKRRRLQIPLTSGSRSRAKPEGLVWLTAEGQVPELQKILSVRIGHAPATVEPQL